jgi:hypothetical protein
MRTFLKLAAGLALGAGLGGCGAEAPLDGAEIDTLDEAIINGDVPTQGALEDYGVVFVSTGCTGTLITNRHVLTAHHCVRAYNEKTSTWAANANTGMSVQLENAAGFQAAVAVSQIYEPTETWPDGSNSLVFQAADYALLELATAQPVLSNVDAMYNAIHSGTDSGLDEKSVFCIGYGGTDEATFANPPSPGTFASGFGTLTSAQMTINDVGAGWNRRNRTSSNQVGFGGDSGSTCFYNDKLAGVQSTCSATWVDVDRDGVDDGWAEKVNTAECTSAAPGKFRSFVENIVLADVSVRYSFSPALPSGTTVNATAVTPKGSQTFDARNAWSGSDVASRSGYVNVKVDSEPAKTMCQRLEATTPMSGDISLRAVCLGDGVVSAML